jgi:hypothetical protein
VQKYSDGKVKRTLKRRSKVLENVKRETDQARNNRWASPFCCHYSILMLCFTYVSKLNLIIMSTFGILFILFVGIKYLRWGYYFVG